MRSPTHAAGTEAQAAWAALGLRALGEGDLDAVLKDALETVVEILGVELCGFLEARPEPGTYAFRAGVGWPQDLAGATVAAGRDAAVAFVTRSQRPVVYEDLATETRFSPPRVLLEQGVRGGIGVVVHGPDRPLGLLGVHTLEPRRFTDDEVVFVQAVATIIAEAIERIRARDAARERGEVFQRLAEGASDLIFRLRVHPTVGYEYVNRASEAILGYTPEELYEHPERALETLHAGDRQVVLAPGSDPSSTVLRYRASDGSTVWCEANLLPITDEHGRVVAVEGIAREASAHKRESELLRHAYERERAIADELRSLDTMKNAFLQAVSHELRTPLAVVLGFAVTLEDHVDRLAPDERDTIIKRLAANARELDRLLRDLLDLDRLMRRTIEPNRRPTDVRLLVDHAVGRVDLGGHPVTVDGDGAVLASIDEPKVERIVENLLANAARHTPAGAQVWVRVESAGDGVLLTVADDGPGVSDELKTSIFEPFKQGLTPAHAPGAGIGLALVERFAALHGGRAWVEDRPGGGAQFRVLLPGEGAPSAAPSAAPPAPTTSADDLPVSRPSGQRSLLR